MSNQWWKVILDGRDDLIRKLNAEDLIPRYTRARQSAGDPANADVYTSNVSGEDSGRARVYFFEPEAANFAKELLTEYSAEPCPAPDLSKLREL